MKTKEQIEKEIEDKYKGKSKSFLEKELSDVEDKILTRQIEFNKRVVNSIGSIINILKGLVEEMPDEKSKEKKK